MAGALTISTLNDSSGVLAAQNGMTGIAKAWVNFDGGYVNTPATIYGSFNISSVTYSSTGVFVINFTTAMPNANYSYTTGCDFYGSSTGMITATCFARSTTGLSVNVNFVNNTTYNTSRVSFAILGS